ncbi:MAG: Major facilitator superfamily MFS-1 [Candidatus Syntrophoarchaeum caldarius]|uniref:Major facilitator superfamily MFS-1 n=1 Tax=Candidatus Syntropharchaeum caldarium TaxID=1838285 RepID=A0A1F2PC89_9EURY|nr:MAG: Major facilitator superfamily MFS-1 [Candidatus Syntrophoarchaeum caldarius]
MRSRKYLLILLYFSVFLGPFGGNTVLALIPSLERFFNVDISFIAASITLYMIPFAFFQIFSGALSDIYGRRRTILFGLFTFSIASLFCASSDRIWFFLTARALQGLGSAFISPTVMAMIGDIFPYSERGRIMGGYGASTTAGIALGPLAGGFLAMIDWRLVFVMLSIFSGLLGSSYLIYLDESGTEGELRDLTGRIRAVIGRKEFLLLSVIGTLVFFGNIATMTFLSDTLKVSVSEDKIGILLSTFGFLGIVTAPVAGYLTDFIGRKKTLLTGLMIMLASFLIFLPVNSYTSFFIPIAVMGAGSTTVFTSLNTMVVECVPGSRGAASSIYNSFRFLGYGLAPLATLPVYLRFGIDGIVILCMGLVIVNIVIAHFSFKRYFIKRRKANHQ